MTAMFRWLAVPIALALAAPVHAQTSSALGGLDTSGPIDVSAASGTLASRDRRATLTGAVKVTQGNLRLDADRLTITYTTDAGTQIQRLDASGGVVVTAPTETARSQFAIYDLNRRVITMLGGVVLRRAGGSEVRSQRLVYDLASGRANVDGGAQGGRVTGRFTVPDRQ
jgi:lipopolysaccharide export system protein LptA